MWEALSAEISVLQNVPLHANENSKLILKYHVHHAVSSDARAIHATLITIFPIIVGEVE